jgi:hypothetical protein
LPSVKVGYGFFEAIDELGIAYACFFFEFPESCFFFSLVWFNVAFGEIPMPRCIIKQEIFGMVFLSDEYDGTA